MRLTGLTRITQRLKTMTIIKPKRQEKVLLFGGPAHGKTYTLLSPLPSYLKLPETNVSILSLSFFETTPSKPRFDLYQLVRRYGARRYEYVGKS